MTKSTRALCILICVSVVIADGISSTSSISRGLTSFPKYCHGTSISCQLDDECIDVSSSSTSTIENENENDHASTHVACAYPFEETAAEAPNHTKKVKVFIMMGQSNMKGFGQVGPEETPGTLLHSISDGKYPHLVEVNNQHPTPSPSPSTWSKREDVRIVYRKSSTKYWQSDLKVGWDGSRDNFIGPEIQFGNIMGHIYDNPVLIIKVGTGGRSLGFDFLPEGSERYTYGDRSFSGHGQCPQSSLSNSTPAKVEDCDICNPKSSINKDCPVFWTSKDACQSTCGTGLYAGHQFDEDFQNTIAILNDMEQYYPGYDGQGFEIGGFVFWQGFQDTLLEAHASRYSINMKKYIEAIGDQYTKYPGEKKFVHATIGHGGCNDDNISPNTKLVYNAQRAISGDRSYHFQGKVTAVDARSYWKEKSVSPAPTKSHHYYNNADTYMEVGNALGWAMVDLLFESAEYAAGSCGDTTSPSTSTSTSPSGMNSSPPTAYRNDNPPCTNSPLKFQVETVGGSFLPFYCKWAKKERFDDFACSSTGQVATHCPKVCGTCSEYGCSDSKGVFFIENGQERECSWLQEMKKVRRIKKCKKPSIAKTCRATCKFCE